MGKRNQTKWLVSGLLVVLTAFALAGCGGTSTENNSNSSTATDTQSADENNSGVSKAEFDQIQNGITYDQVVEIIGGPGEVVSEVGAKGEQYYTIIYQYEGESGLGSNANFTFQDNKLQMKAQAGLE